MDKQQRIKDIQKEILKYNLLDSVPMIMIGLALYAKFSGAEHLIFSFLENETVVNGMLILAIPVVIFCAVKIALLSFERMRLEKQS